jgi:uncharacterized protein (TIGR03084 family)
MSDPYQELIDDLIAEQQYLDAQLAEVPDEVWQHDTPCRGWMVRDVISHLAEVDESATNVALGLGRSMTAGERSEDGTRSAMQDSSRHMTRTQLVDWWRAGRGRMEAALRAHDGRDRMPWAGPPMSARSFATARLMECWSHGLDALDGAGVEPAHSDRLQHIAHLGFITRTFAYQTRGLDANTEPLKVELILPSGAGWTRGEEDASNLVSGAAVDFCRVVTQRIHYKDTDLDFSPGAAEEFLQVAQAFAGPPGEGRPQRS